MTFVLFVTKVQISQKKDITLSCLLIWYVAHLILLDSIQFCLPTQHILGACLTGTRHFLSGPRPPPQRGRANS